MKYPGLVLILVSLLVFPARAAELSLLIKTEKGKPVADAVVTVHPEIAVDDAEIEFPWLYEVSQVDMRFDPFVLVVPRGADVAFPNRDRVRHHVYSFSPLGPFELKLYGRGESPSVTFDEVGVLAIGCNIHDAMVGYIKVVDTPFAAKSRADGRIELRELPAGPVEIRIWHPHLAARTQEITLARALTADALLAETVTVALKRPRLRRNSY